MLPKELKTWVPISGELEPIDFSGKSDYRFPEHLIMPFLEYFTLPGDWILDPFCGFGTTAVASQKLGRHCIGFEINKTVASFANQRIALPSEIRCCDAFSGLQQLTQKFDAIVTSPPIDSFRFNEAGSRKMDGRTFSPSYEEDWRKLIQLMKAALTPSGVIMLDSVNFRFSNGKVEPVAFNLCRIANDYLEFIGEYICCNTSNAEAIKGYNHSYMFVFRNRLEQEAQ